MEIAFNWNIQQYPEALATILCSFFFSAFWFISNSSFIMRLIFANNPEETAWVKYIVFQKISGFLLLGFIPGFLILNFTTHNLNSLGFNLQNFSTSLYYLLGMGLPIIGMSYFSTRREEDLAYYPQMRVKNWTTLLLGLNGLAWLLYMVAYEFLFRGILLFVCYQRMGFWPAVAINVALYSTTHIPKSLRETLVCIPYGFLLCYLTLSTGNLIIAIGTHYLIALSNDCFSIYHNKEMKFRN